jgi:hypothetical protein
LRTTKTTLPDHLQSIDPNQLSKTFRDAVQVTRRLGLQYLGIDSLCIVQDDEEDWQRESSVLEYWVSLYRISRIRIGSVNAVLVNSISIV